MKKNGNLEKFRTPDGIRQFLLERGSATVDEIAAALGISRASYYRIIDMIMRELFAGRDRLPTDKDKGTPEMPWFHQALMGLVTQNPSWSCHKLAQALSTEKYVSGPTIQKELSRTGLGTQSARFAHVERMVWEAAIKKEPLPDIPESLLKHNPSIADLNLLSTSPGPVFVADVLTVTHAPDSDKHRLLLVYCVNTQACHLESYRSTQSIQFETEGMRRALAFATQHITSIGDTAATLISCSKMGLDSSSGLNKRVPISRRSCDKRKLPVTFRMLARKVRKEVVPSFVEACQEKGALEADRVLQQWMDRYNNSPKDGFRVFEKPLDIAAPLSS